MFVIRGLGNSSLLTKIEQRNAGVVAPKPGSAWSPDHAGTVGIKQHSRWDIHVLKDRLINEQITRARAVQAEMFSLYGSQMPSAKEIGYSSNVCGQMEREFTQGWSKYGWFSPRDMLTPVGQFNVLGVPLTLDQLQSVGAGDSITVSYKPTPDQQLLADVAVYHASQRALFKRVVNNYLDDLPEKLLWFPHPGIGRTLIETGGELDKHLAKNNGSLLQVVYGLDADNHTNLISGPGEYTTYIPGYSLNPIQPTAAELTQPGGFRAYYKRGGYLLSRSIAAGAYPVSSGHRLTATTGYFRCGDRVYPATQENYGAELQGWRLFVTVGDQYQVRAQALDRSLGDKVLSVVSLNTLLEKILKAMCGNREIVNHINRSVLLAEICVDKNGKKCTKGSEGCTCTGPTSIEQAGVVAADRYLGWMCGDAQSQGQPRPPGFVPPVFTPPPPAPPPAARSIPWWLVVAGGVTAGAIVFSRR